MPDPNEDAIMAVFVAHLPTGADSEPRAFCVFQFESDVDVFKERRSLGYDLLPVHSEKALIEQLVEEVNALDPDVLIGYEIQNMSWGYLVDRAWKYGIPNTNIKDIDFSLCISRILDKKGKSRSTAREDNPHGFKKQSTLSSAGRIFLNVWRQMKGEFNLTSYTLENMAFHVLHKRIPRFSFDTLTGWYRGRALTRWRTMKYYFDRVFLNLELLESTDLIRRTSEFARVFGIDFYSVINRGSQFKVESMMCRIAKPENFIMISPSRKQVLEMRAVECLPLVMEPESRFYTSPLVVLDFQSLYPSIMIGYNYCFSTCLGKIQNLGETHKLGVKDDYILPLEVLDKLKDDLIISPNGLAFVKPNVRKGVIGRMLSEILDTRIMVKKSMKLYKNDKALLRSLNAVQMGMKLLANVTYGYAGASFSGRMPCCDLADAIVQTGRETLEKAIKLIHETSKWNAKVVYGDTDSLFVYLEGASKETAFQIGEEIVAKITQANPFPVKLKFEKVYHPSVLLTKKRYVGFKYEYLGDEPVFEAKGIETVRRDGCPAVGKMLENSLKYFYPTLTTRSRLLFRNPDLSNLKAFLFSEWTKILTGHVSVQDFVIAKAVKLGTYKDLPPGALISVNKMSNDARAEPQYGERVPYVVVHGGPNARLIDQVVSPETLLENPNLYLNGVYYITKQIIPPLSRVFNLIGVDLEAWWAQMPKVKRGLNTSSAALKATPFYRIDECINCGEVSDAEFCVTCKDYMDSTRFNLAYRYMEAEKRYKEYLDICRSCSGLGSLQFPQIECVSLDCNILYEKIRALRKLEKRQGFLGY